MRKQDERDGSIGEGGGRVGGSGGSGGSGGEPGDRRRAAHRRWPPMRVP